MKNLTTCFYCRRRGHHSALCEFPDYCATIRLRKANAHEARRRSFAKLLRLREECRNKAISSVKVMRLHLRLVVGNTPTEARLFPTPTAWAFPFFVSKVIPSHSSIAAPMRSEPQNSRHMMAMKKRAYPQI
ncbi:unnamed protein product [Haemonchus placei]|uniref:CCHC-type domain-containing protein n=1 Tax=Haemonchus placei TaxID=6290 RepID=A0A158QLF7_HAEPC|nr:unnamed protein product [Haemonchus placei]